MADESATLHAQSMLLLALERALSTLSARVRWLGDAEINWRRRCSSRNSLHPCHRPPPARRRWEMRRTKREKDSQVSMYALCRTSSSQRKLQLPSHVLLNSSMNAVAGVLAELARKLHENRQRARDTSATSMKPYRTIQIVGGPALDTRRLPAESAPCSPRCDTASIARL